MKLLTNEAYITKSGTIKLGSVKTNTPFRFINPIKGEYNRTLQNKIEDLLEQNQDSVLELEFGKDKYYITSLRGAIVSFNSVEDAIKNHTLDTCFSADHDWYELHDKFLLKDCTVSRVIIRGLP